MVAVDLLVARDTREGDEKWQDEPKWFSAQVSRLDTIEQRESAAIKCSEGRGVQL